MLVYLVAKYKHNFINKQVNWNSDLIMYGSTGILGKLKDSESDCNKMRGKITSD